VAALMTIVRRWITSLAQSGPFWQWDDVERDQGTVASREGTMVKMWRRVSAPTRVGPNAHARSFPLRHGRTTNPPRPFRNRHHRILPVPAVPPSQTPPPDGRGA